MMRNVATHFLAAAVAVTLALVPVNPVVADTAARFEAAKTPKGLSFYYRENATTPFAAINFGMRDVYALTTRGKEGLNALGGALVMQGADGAGQTEFLERLKDLTAGATISLGPFSSQGNVRSPTSTIAASMALMASALNSAAPSDKLLARLKERANGGEAQAALRAETIAERTAYRFALGDHPITRTFDTGRYDRIGRDDLAQWRQAVLGRDRLRIAASGRIAKAEAARIIDEAFADLPSLPPPAAFVWPDLDFSGATIVVEHDTPQSAVLMIGLTSIGVGREAETALVANAVLGGSNGRLWQGVRTSLGSTYGASSGFQLVGPGKRLVTLRAAVANDQVKASVDAVKAAYATWRSEGVTAAELTATTARFITDFRSALDEPTRANALVIAMQLASRSVDDIATYETRIGGIERDTLNRFIADKFPAPERFVTVIVTPRADGLGATCIVRAADEAERCRK